MKHRAIPGLAAVLLTAGCGYSVSIAPTERPDAPAPAAQQTATAGPERQPTEVVFPVTRQNVQPFAPGQDDLEAVGALFAPQGSAFMEGTAPVQIRDVDVLGRHPYPNVSLGLEVTFHNAGSQPLDLAVYVGLWNDRGQMEYQHLVPVRLLPDRVWRDEILGPTPLTVGPKEIVVGLASRSGDRWTGEALFDLDTVEVIANPGSVDRVSFVQSPAN